MMTLGVVTVSHMLARKNLRSVRLQRQFPNEIYADTQFSVQYRIETDAGIGGGGFAVAESDPLTADDSSLMFPPIPNEDAVTASGRYSITARGEHLINKANLSTTYPFGLAKYSREIGESFLTVVFPKLEPLDKEITSRLTGSGLVTEHPDPFGTIPYGFRQYVIGDTYKHIDWKKTAQHGDLITRTLADEKTREILITLPGDASERAISRAASLAAHCVDSAIPVALIGPGVRIEPAQDRGHLRKILTVLALWERKDALIGGVDGFVGTIIHIESDGRFHSSRNGDAHE